MKLLTVEDARGRMLAEIAPLGPEPCALEEAAGRVLAEPVAAVRDQPPYDASAMDGWAVRAADTPGTLAILGESAAGHGYDGAVGPGQAVRIFTGAMLPAGADAVAIQEDVTREGDRIVVPPTAAGHHVRHRGKDFRAGEALLQSGARLDPWRLSLAASAGRGVLSVARRPQVAVISTGEEIVAAGGEVGLFQIFDAGGPAIRALVRAWGGEAVSAHIVGDDEAAIAEAIRPLACDLIVTVGGASVGDHDLVKPALARLGLALKVENLAMRPGKPTWFGTLADGRRVLGLPGNPASALACAELFLRPIVAAYLGADTALPMATARLTTPAEANGAREHWMRAKLSHGADGLLQATPLRDQDSSLVSVFTAADALLKRPVGAPAAEAGALVEVLPLARA